jgi:glycosyltransferase involved in cell wall biosynthesis
MSSKKIAIYSGVIPSTVFIERLITGIANSGNKVLLFGLSVKKYKHQKNVSVYSYSNRIQKLFVILKYSILLWLFNRKEKQKLDKIIRKKHKNRMLNKVKYYPVLYHKPDVFHLQWAKSLKDWMWVQEFGMKLIVSLRGTHVTISPLTNPDLGNFYKRQFPKVDGFHAVSKSIEKTAVTFGANPARTNVIYSGLDLDKFIFNDKKIRGKRLKIISVGRSHWVKGYTYALDACSVLNDANFDFDYTIVGINQDEELMVQCSQLGLGDRVHFLPSQSFEKVQSLIQEADVLLLASIEEGIANVVLEAMALGTLVVLTDCGGLDEVIINGENGFLIPARNSTSIAEVLQRVATLSVNEYQQMTLSARKMIENQHSEMGMVDKMDPFYETILNEIV